MSADNTVIVLKTKGKNGNDAEYRVARVQCAENMAWEADYPSRDNPRLNRQWVLDTFNGRVFTSANEALKQATRIKREATEVEYDVHMHDYSDVFFPATDRKRRQRRFVRQSGQRQSVSARW